jgi:hypothetical protein
MVFTTQYSHDRYIAQIAQVAATIFAPRFVTDLILISSAQTNACADQNIIPHRGCILNGQKLQRMAVSMQRLAILHNALFWQA